MKFGNHTLRKVENVGINDIVCFSNPQGDYKVTDIEKTKIGQIRHHHKLGSNSYWPNELVYVLNYEKQT